MIDERLKKRLLKLKKLADYGVGGEAENASTILANLLKKHNISEEDIGIDVRGEETFKCKERFHENILNRTISNVCNEDRQYKLQNMMYMVNLTSYELAQTVLRYDLLVKSYDKMVMDYQMAFLVKNKLFLQSDYEDAREEENLTDEEIEEIKKINRFQWNIDETVFPTNLLEKENYEK